MAPGICIGNACFGLPCGVRDPHEMTHPGGVLLTSYHASLSCLPNDQLGMSNRPVIVWISPYVPQTREAGWHNPYPPFSSQPRGNTKQVWTKAKPYSPLQQEEAIYIIGCFLGSQPRTHHPQDCYFELSPLILHDKYTRWREREGVRRQGFDHCTDLKSGLPRLPDAPTTPPLKRHSFCCNRNSREISNL